MPLEAHISAARKLPNASSDTPLPPLGEASAPLRLGFDERVFTFNLLERHDCGRSEAFLQGFPCVADTFEGIGTFISNVFRTRCG